ncbi:hypothetical protein BEL04_22730 [Mucilaginibacter sp. PPCGB 2223]|uniref:reverse transcriptase family protein n=1 Tax=Mucilaginibacter sp. PPCGB 2223 TaxID=1886027 RepID=UPI00082438CB|nr:reverse transcriptase family protein [Mucilaginibacter sp. PPCGB 2223]OCX50593.1 hypothetical protein BEL04_22730 [Mucilaginibacter sp. PPCGB 2223]
MPFDFEEFRKIAKSNNHSEEYIFETIKYAEKLNKKDLPVIFSTVHLAIELKIPSNILNSLLKSYNYTFFNLHKRSGGFREIMVPNEKLKYVQRWINFNILQKLPLEKVCTGFRPNYSILTNANIHANSKMVLKVDLLRFFDTITDRRVYGYFKSLGYLKPLSYDLAKLVTARHKKSYWDFVSKDNCPQLADIANSNSPVLPQGAPTSPMLANLLASRMDERFIILSQKLNFRYSRYADDLTFSITEEGQLPFTRVIKKIIEEEGFFMNDSKTKIFSRGMKQYVTGLTVTHGVHVSKKDRKDIFMHLHFCKKLGPNEHLKNWSKKNGLNREPYGFQDWLLGKISFIYSIDKIIGTKMFKEFDKINWSFENSN